MTLFIYSQGKCPSPGENVSCVCSRGLESGPGLRSPLNEHLHAVWQLQKLLISKHPFLRYVNTPIRCIALHHTL